MANGVPLAALLLSVAGAFAVSVAWLLVLARRATVWGAMGTVLGVLGVVSLATERVFAAEKIEAAHALLVGGGVGIVLYGLTAAFLLAARRWQLLARHTEELYDQRHGVSLSRALFIAVLVVVPGEELFWRGVVQGFAGDAWGPELGALAAWGLYVLANAASGSLPVLLGVAVGGAVWGGLAFWSGGVLAPLGCHAVWTALMIVRRRA